MDIRKLAGARFVLVTTFRKTGAAVPTPMLAARDGNTLAVWTAAKSGKVKRIRNDPRVTVAASSARGIPRGDAVHGAAECLNAEQSERVKQLLIDKYGLIMRLDLLVRRLRRKDQEARVAVRITPDG